MMTAQKDSLDRIEIGSPCNNNWDEMTGSDQIRYCAECDKYVYNLSAMTRREAEELLATRRSQMCTRMIRDLDGRTITVGSLPPVRLLGRRPGAIASTVVSTILTIAPGAAALSKTPRSSSQPHSQNEPARKASRSVSAGTTGAIAGTVSDQKGAPIAGAVVTLTSEASGEVLSQITSQTGEFRFDGLSARTYIFEIKAKGYQLPKQHGLDLQSGEVHRMDAVLEQLVSVMGAMGLPAQPLRTLYVDSDRVVVATVGKSTVVEKNGSSRFTRTPMTVSQTIKGDGHKPVVAVFEWDYMARQNPIKEGDTVLAFLQRKEDGKDGYQPIYGSTSIKKLSESGLATYVRRLGELKELIGHSKPNSKAITEWLVRCAEDPVTRWDGTFELQLSAWQEKRQQEENERRNSAQNENSLTVLMNPLSTKFHDPEATFAALLSSDQKDRLMNMLLTSADLDQVAFQLIEVAESWNDARLLPFLVGYLDRMRDTPTESVRRVMLYVARLLDDEKMSEMVDQ